MKLALAAIALCCRAYLDTWSNIDTPPVRSVHRRDGTFLFYLDAAPERRSAPSSQQFLTVKAHDGVRLDSLLIRPRVLDPGRKYPVIIEVNGQPRQQSVRNAWDGPKYAWRQAMAERGYVILVLDCRGAGGHG